jgi:hypothetical protein
VAENTLENLLKNYCGIEQVLIGDDLAWDISGQADEIAVIKVAEAG